MRICRRAASRLLAAVAGALLAAPIEAAPAGPPPTAGEALARMTLGLTDDRPYRFVLAYHGPLMPFRGLVCYHFAGYNETCLDPHIDWLTPATEIPLYAPGGVPRDLLKGYVMLVRYPALSQRTFRYPLAEAR